MNIDDFFPLILAEVLGCPDPTVRTAVVMAAIDFTREALAWTELQDAVPLVHGISDYSINAPTDGYLLTVRDVWINGSRLQPITLSELRAGWQSEQASVPTYYNQSVARGSLRFFPAVAEPNGASFVVRAAYTPTPTATSLPDFLGQRHMDVICSGAKARLLLMAGAPWFNQGAGMYHKQIFDDGVIKSRVEEAHDRVRGTVRVSPRSFGF